MVSLEEHPHLNLTDESATEGEAIGRRETKALHSVKLLVIAFLVIAAVVVAVAVYVFLSKSEEREFEHNFDIFADKVLGAIGKSLDQTLGAVDSYLLDIVSSNRHAGGSWPFVTVPNFSVRSAKLLSLSNAVMLSMHPLVTGKERSLWENYTAHQNHWVRNVHLTVTSIGSSLQRSNAFLSQRSKKALKFKTKMTFIMCRLLRVTIRKMLFTL